MLPQPIRPFLNLLAFLLLFLCMHAQDKNPFKSIGKQGKIITLSNGKYEELFDQDSIQRIGTSLVNIRQMKVVKLLETEGEGKSSPDNSTANRFLSVDPLARNFAWNSPYAYAENSPVKFIDLDGAEKYDPASKPTGVTHVQLATVPISTQEARTDYSIKAGPYQLYPISDPSGKRNAYWLARYTYTEGPYAGMHRDDWIVGTDGVGDFVGNGEKYYNRAGWIENFGGADQQFNLGSVLKGYRNTWNPQNIAIGLTMGMGAVLRMGAKVDLMGGQRSTLGKSWVNYDRQAIEGISDDVANFGKHFGKNSVSELVVNNPQAEFIQHVTESVKKGGTITIRGQMANKYFKNIWEAESIEGYEIINRQSSLPKAGYSTSSGTPLKGGENSINEVILKKR